MFPNLSSASNRGSSYSVGYENPLFKVRMIPTTDELQAKQDLGRPDRANDYADKFAVGDIINGKEIRTDDTFEGEIISITKNSQGDGMILVILDDDEKKRKIDASTASLKKPPIDHGLDTEYGI